MSVRSVSRFFLFVFFFSFVCLVLYIPSNLYIRVNQIVRESIYFWLIKTRLPLCLQPPLGSAVAACAAGRLRERRGGLRAGHGRPAGSLPGAAAPPGGGRAGEAEGAAGRAERGIGRAVPRGEPALRSASAPRPAVNLAAPGTALIAA